MSEQKSSATILALADLADISANQLETGHSVEEVIALLRRAALAVRETVPIANDDDPFADELVADAEWDGDDGLADTPETATSDGATANDAVDGVDASAQILSLADELTPMNLEDLTETGDEDPKPISA